MAEKNNASSSASCVYTKESNAALPKFTRGVSLLCWAYNEEELIERYLRRVHALLSQSCLDFEIVIIDDCSTDSTPQIIKKLQEEFPEIKPFRNERNLNVGLSCRRAIQNASKEFLFWQTVDWSYDISMLRTFLEFLHEYDVVVGVRRAPVPVRTPGLRYLFAFFQLLSVNHLALRSDNVSKAMVSIINFVLIRAMFRVRFSDFQNIVFYRTEFVQSIEMEAKSSFVNPELLLKTYWNNCRIREVPISFIPRTAGKAKGTKPKAIFASVQDIFSSWFKWIVLGKLQRGKGTIDRYDKSMWEA